MDYLNDYRYECDSRSQALEFIKEKQRKGEIKYCSRVFEEESSKCGPWDQSPYQVRCKKARFVIPGSTMESICCPDGCSDFERKWWGIFKELLVRKPKKLITFLWDKLHSLDVRIQIMIWGGIVLCSLFYFANPVFIKIVDTIALYISKQ